MLAVETDLRVEARGLRMRIHGGGRVLTCRLDSDWANLIATFRGARHVLRMLRLVLPVLSRASLRLDIVVGTVRLAQAGNGVQANAAARMLRLRAVRFGP